MNWRLGNLLTN